MPTRLSATSVPVLDECTRRGIAFAPYAPLGSGAAGPRPLLSTPTIVRIATRLGCTPAQVALSWSLQLSPNVLLIPGTSSLRHLRENLAVAEVELDDEAVGELSMLGTTPWPES